MCEPPLRSPTIVGRAVDTIVWSSAASDMPSISAPMMSRIARRDRSGRAPLPVRSAPLALTAAVPPAYSGGVPPSEELDVLIVYRPFGFEVLGEGWWCPGRCRAWRGGWRRPGPLRRRGQVAQRAVFGEPGRERLEGGVGQLLERHAAAGGGPERHGRPQHRGGRAGQQHGVGIAV